MPVVDGHCHVSTSWFEPVETLLYEMDRVGVQSAVLTQLLGQTDNTYQQACLRRYRGRFASVVWIDTASPEAIHDLRRLADAGASGVRLRPAARSAGGDPLGIWRVAAQRGLSVSCPGTAIQFASTEFAELVRAVPELTVVLEHYAASSRPDVDDSERAQRQAAFGLARFPNVCIKIGGLGEFAARANPPRAPFPFQEPLPAYLDQIYAAFGPSRMLWGSDFPLVAAREGYANALVLCRQALAQRPIADLDLIFGGTAARVFPIR